MQEVPPPNFICRPYRGVSVQDLPGELDESSLRAHLIGRPVYRRTEFMVARHHDERAIVQLEHEVGDELFAPVLELRYLAGPGEVAYHVDPEVDTANASQMARVVLASGREAAIHVIEGRFQHVNFIVAPRPLRVRVIEVVPPEPPKLLDMAQRVLDFDEELPPVELEPALIDLRRLARDTPARRYLLPCRCSGLELDAPVDFLDAGPAERDDWTLIGCERSRQFHEFFYGKDPPYRVDLCPRVAAPPGSGPTLSKCCLLERGIEHDAEQVIVPWGASLDEVRAALHLLAEAGAVTSATANA